MRIAIVNDLVVAIQSLANAVVSCPAHRLAWIAQDGAQAVELCARDRPDLILMDLMMPRMDGVEATRRIMTASPCPILLVTGSIRKNAARVFEAMGAGALDAVNTPIPDAATGTADAEPLLAKIEMIRRLSGQRPAHKPLIAGQRPSRAAFNPREALVAIGASAGGPAALARLLGLLPADFPMPVVIVQHVNHQFARDLAEWLASHAPLGVRVARQGEAPEPGTVLLAGRDQHLTLGASGRLEYVSEPAQASYRPSIDVFFKSIDRYWPGDVIAVVLTGMGRDGAEGLRALRQRGHYTIAQSRATSAVYGMPKTAAEIHAATDVLPLGQIASRLKSIVGHRTALHV